MKFSIYRFDPDADAKPRMQNYDVTLRPSVHMLLDAILEIKEKDDSLTIRKSCREGVCGSDAININGRNGLACVTPINTLQEPVVLRPLPSFPVIRDLVVDMTQFYKQYHSIKPYLINLDIPPETERLQLPHRRGDHHRTESRDRHGQEREQERRRHVDLRRDGVHKQRPGEQRLGHQRNSQQSRRSRGR